MIRATLQDFGGKWLVVVTHPALDRPGRYRAEIVPDASQRAPEAILRGFVADLRNRTWREAAQCCALAGGCI